MTNRERKIALAMNCYRGYPFEETLQAVRAAGFEYIELTSSEKAGDAVHINRNRDELRQTLKLISSAGLEPLALSGHTDLFRPAAATELTKKIQLADLCGCRFINTFIGEPVSDDITPALETVRAVTGELEKRNITLCVEVHGRFSRGKELSEFVHAVGSDNVRINYDTANCIFYGDVNAEKDLPTCLNDVGYLHIKDKLGGRDEWNFPALGEGYVDFCQIFEILKNAEINCPFSVEIEFTPGGASSIEEVNLAVAKSHRYLVEHGFHLYK